MFVKEPQQYLYGAIFFPSLFFILNFIIRKFFLHWKVPISKKAITETDAWDIAAKIVTSTYSVLSTICGLMVMIITYEDIYNRKHWVTSAWARFGLAYYYYDTLIKVESMTMDSGRAMTRKEKWVSFIRKDTLMFVHHIVLPIVFYPVIIHFRNDACDFFVACFYFSDFPVPFIQLRHVLARVDLREIALYPLNGVFMTVAFAICRVLIFPYMYYVCGKINGISIWEVPGMIPKKCTISCGFLIAIQIYWLSVMVRGLLSYFSNKGSEATKKR